MMLARIYEACETTLSFAAVDAWVTEMDTDEIM